MFIPIGLGDMITFLYFCELKNFCSRIHPLLLRSEPFIQAYFFNSLYFIPTSMFQRFTIMAAAGMISVSSFAAIPPASKAALQTAQVRPMAVTADSASACGRQTTQREEQIAPPPQRAGERITEWEWTDAKPASPFQTAPTTSMAVGDVKNPVFNLPSMKAPGDIKYGTIIPKDPEVKGTLHTSAMQLIKGPGEMDTLFNISLTQSKILININTETGLVTLPPQKVLDHKTYGDVYVYSCAVRNGQLTYDPTKEIQGRIDSNGKITLTGYGIFVADGPNKGAWFYAYTRGDWYPANATVTLSNSDKTTSVFNALIEQPYPNQIDIYNFVGYANPVSATLNSDKSIRITPQLIYTNAMYGPFFNYPCDKIDGKYALQTGKYTTGTGTDKKITTGPWAVSARMAPTTYVAMLIDHATIETEFTLVYPTPLEGGFEGSGTDSDPYRVKSVTDLARLAQQTATQTFEGKVFRLENDLNLASLTSAFQPIGEEGAPFEGTFDGNHHTISGLNFNGCGFHFTGLFGMLGKKGSVKNLKIDKFTITSNGNWIAPVVADNDGTISDVTVTNSQVISNGQSGGGIAGRSTGSVERCSSSGTIIGIGSVAGIVGYSYGSIRDCHSDATVQRAGHLNDVYRDCGGIAGTITATGEDINEMSRCSFSGTISESSGFGIAGGLAAKLNRVKATDCFNVGTISHKRNDADYDNYTGGIAGWISASEVTDCFNAGTIIKSSDRGLSSDAVGGLIGYVRVSYSSINGAAMTMKDKSTVARCYNSAPVISSSNEGHKGIWGATFTYSGFDPIPETFSDCWFDQQINGIADETFGKPTDFLTSGQLPANFSSTTWTAQSGRYPVLKTHASTQASGLASSAMILTDGENVSKVKKSFTLSAPEGIVWKLLNAQTSSYTDETASLKITGNKVTIKDSYATEVLSAITPDGKSARAFRLAIVPKLFDGEGTAENPYLVKSAADFRTIDMAVGTYGQSHNGDFFRMTGDIDFSNASDFQGVGARLGTSVSFGATFDGDGHYIRNLKIKAVELDSNYDPINGSFYSYAGLFNVLNRYATIKNLNIASDCRFDTYISGGSIAGYTEGRIENCRNYSTVYGARQYVGGIAGNVGSTGVITGCYNAGSIGVAYSGIGGIVGYNRGTISFCQNDGEVRGIRPDGSETSQSIAGGIAGFHGGLMTSCVNNANVRAGSATGGLIGQISSNLGLTGDMHNCLNNGIVSLFSEVSSRGGLIGSAGTFGNITSNYYDAGANINGATSNGAMAGCTGVITSTLTSGNALDGLPASDWDYRKGAFPVLKRFADEPLSTTLRTMFVDFPEGQSRANINSNIPLSSTQGTIWTLAQNKEFRVNGNTLEVTVPTGMTMGVDTLTASLGDVTKVYMIKTIPTIFEGDGTISSPYLIKTTDDMKKLAEFIDITSFDYSGFNFRLVNDLDFHNIPWRIVCPYTVRFNANFDGNGKKLSGYDFTASSNKAGEGSYIGLFGVVGEAGHIHDLTVEGSFAGTNFVGGIVGDLYGRISDCVNRSKVTTEQSGASGIAARVFAGGVVSGCRNEGTIISTGTNAGGIVGSLKVGGRIENCVNDGNVTSLSAGAGGITAETGGAIIGCRNLKPVVATSSVAGIVANSTPDATEITNCHNEADLSVSNLSNGSTAAGILCRSSNAGSHIRIEDCTNSGKIVSKGHSAGIVAYAYGGVQISRCVNTGTISNTGASNAGGIVSEATSGSGDFITRLENCVNHGHIDAHWGYSGGVAGLLSSGVEAYDCYNDGPVTMTPYTPGSITALTQWLCIGGFAGSIRGHNVRCWNAGDVTSDFTCVGGFTGVAQSSDQLPVIDGCFNLGNVTAKATIDHTSGHAGGLCGYTVGRPEIRNFFNLGEIKGKKNIGGLAGMLHGDVTMRSSYNAGKVTIEGTATSRANIANISSNGSLNASEIFYNSDINPAGANDKAEYALTTAQLFNAPLGDGFKYSPASYPLIPGILVEEPVAYEAAFAAPMEEGDNPQALKNHVYVGNSDKVDWTGSDHFLIINGIAYAQKTGEATLTASSRASDKTKTFTFVIKEVAGVDTAEVAKEIESRLFIDINGFTVTQNPVSGKVYIIQTRYTDGTSSTVKALVP